MSVTITITGLEEFQAKLDPVRFVQAVDKAVDRAAETLRDRTKELPPVSAKTTGYDAKGIPVDTGRLRQSIQKSKTQLLAAEVTARTDYAGYVYGGTSKMPARPFFEWELNDFGGKEAIEQVVNQTLSNYFS